MWVRRLCGERENSLMLNVKGPVINIEYANDRYVWMRTVYWITYEKKEAMGSDSDTPNWYGVDETLNETFLAEHKKADAHWRVYCCLFVNKHMAMSMSRRFLTQYTAIHSVVDSFSNFQTFDLFRLEPDQENDGRKINNEGNRAPLTRVMNLKLTTAILWI